jgi:hypothetical protein
MGFPYSWLVLGGLWVALCVGLLWMVWSAARTDEVAQEKAEGKPETRPVDEQRAA